MVLDDEHIESHLNGLYLTKGNQVAAAGTWKLRFNSDWQGYSDDFQGHPSTDVVAEPGEYDGFPFHAALSMGPYSVLIYSQ